jgi:hypothetical protein
MSTELQDLIHVTTARSFHMGERSGQMDLIKMVESSSRCEHVNSLASLSGMPCQCQRCQIVAMMRAAVK